MTKTEYYLSLPDVQSSSHTNVGAYGLPKIELAEGNLN